MKEKLLEHVHQALAIQLNELTTYYEQEIAKLQRENGALKTKVHRLEKQLASLPQQPKTPVTSKVKASTAEKQPTPVKKASTATASATQPVQATATEKQLPAVKTPIAPATLSQKNISTDEPATAAPKPKQKPIKKTTNLQQAFSLHNFHIINEADLKLFQDEYTLQEGEISVVLFDVEGVEETDQTVQLRAYVSHDETEAFILEKAFKAERKKYLPYRLLGSRKHYAVDWATDHILQKEGSLKRYLHLGPSSELEDFGYEVRTLSNEERWTILQNAVQIIGLKKVAQTIIAHINQRKSQENGEQFYANAIAKWRFDLAQLKKHYIQNKK